MRAVARSFGVVMLLAAAGVAFGCQSIVGIEDKTLVPGCDDKCSTCETYCDLAMTNCTGDNAVYRMRENCIGLCNVLPLGDLDEPANGNTVACRLENARLAGESEPETHCSSAGPAGGTLCGGDCKSFCYLYATVCDSPFETEAACLDKCRALKDEAVFDVNGYYDTDTVECRIIHFANATLDKMHCGHGEFQSSLHCSPPVGTEEDPILPSCPDMCRVAMIACEEDDTKVYDDVDTCIATCEELPEGRNDDNHQNSVGCRHYHSYNSILNPVVHCSHCGPGGAGHCGEIENGQGNCESFCRLAKAGCSTAFAQAYADDAACLADCAAIPGAADNPDTLDVNETEQYSVALGESGNPALEFQCRLLHTTRAIRQVELGDDTTVECGAVFAAAGSACDLD
jgi:hypothetical protein